MNARSLFYFYQLKKNLRLNLLSLQEMQQKRLRAIIKHAYENVPLYRRKFNSVGIKPEDIQSFADLSKVPVITKSEIQASSLEDVVARNVDVNRCLRRTTSGSTGLPLTVILDDRVLDFERAVWSLSFLERGLRLRDKMVVIADPRDFPKAKNSLLQRLRIMRREYISIFDDAQKTLTFLEEYKPEAIKGYPSVLMLLAEVCKHEGNAVKPRLIFTGAELLDNESRRSINSAFGIELLDNYASYEFGLLAWECHEHVGYHINVDGVTMEFIKGGESVVPGERGEIVCTSLVNYTMPLIRYKIGDLGIPSEEQCSCGRTLPLMKIVEGREGDFLVALNGRIIPPTIFSPYPFENFEGIRQFRIIQERRDELTIQLVVRGSFLGAQTLERAKREIQKVFGEGMHVKFQILENIPRDPSGKLRKVVSKIGVQWQD